MRRSFYDYFRLIRDRAHSLPVRIDEAELNACERLSGVQIQLIDLQADRLIRNAVVPVMLPW